MVMIQIRNVPEALHRRLKARAAEEGLSLSDFLLVEVERFATELSWREVADRAAERGAFYVSESPEEAVRAERDAR